MAARLIVAATLLGLGAAFGAPIVQAEMNSASYRIDRDVINYGGGESQSGSYQAFASLGEFAAGLSHSSNYILNAGQPGQANAVITITVDSPTVSLGTLTPGTPVGDGTILTVTTDALNGYSLSTIYSGAMSSGPYTISDFVGTVADPVPWTDNCVASSTQCGFGFSLQFDTALADSDFSASADSAALRTNGTGQDWYESRAQAPTMLTLDEAAIGSNSTKKARLASSTTQNVYLSQEFSTSATTTFMAQWDVYVDDVLDDSTRDRAAVMLVGDDSGGTNGPNSASAERFVHLAFWKNGGGDTGTATLVAQEAGDTFNDSTTWRQVKTGMNLDQWYTIRVVGNLAADTYDVYVDGVREASAVAALTTKTSVGYVSFASWSDSRGAFYIDNVSADIGGVPKWGNGADYAAFTGTATEIYSRGGYSTAATTVTVRYRADVPVTQPTGSYQTTITYTATAAV